jgi:hypothetical protein
MRPCTLKVVDLRGELFCLLAGEIRSTEHVPIPVEWLAVMADPLLAQSAIDRLQSAAYELVVEGESYRRRQRPRRGS